MSARAKLFVFTVLLTQGMGAHAAEGDRCPRDRAHLAPLRAALARHPDGSLDEASARVTWALPNGRSLALERDTCARATLFEVHSPQGFDVDWNKPDLAMLLGRYVSAKAGKDLDMRLHDRRRWFQAPVDNPDVALITDPEPGAGFPAGVYVEQAPTRISVMWADRVDVKSLEETRALRDEQNRLRDGE